MLVGEAASPETTGFVLLAAEAPADPSTIAVAAISAKDARNKGLPGEHGSHTIPNCLLPTPSCLGVPRTPQPYTAGVRWLWARRVSNLRPLACEAGPERPKKAEETGSRKPNSSKVAPPR
jgi:hypothetical protein